MKRVKVLLAFFCLFCVSVASNCNQPKNSDVIKLGAIFDETGSLSYMGKWSKEGAMLAVEDINKKGGIDGKRVELVIEDGATEANKTVSAFQKLIDHDKVSIVIGFNSSSGAMAAAPIANNRKVVLFSSGAASPGVTNAGDYVFRNRLSGKLEVEDMAKFIINQQQRKEIGVIYINNDYGKGFEQIFRKTFEQLGGRIVAEEGFQQDQTDFKTIVQKFKDQKVETIYLIAFAKEGGALLKQSKELNYSPKWYSSNAIEGPEFVDIAGNAAEGLIYSVARYSVNDSSAMNFNTEYKAKYGYDSEMFAANAYDALAISAQAVGKNGSDGEKIKNYLYSVKDYPGVSGTTSFDSNGDVLKPVMFKTVRSGKFVPFDIQ
jgi:branched-chain amino acid transport system substrate-binding protein